jgi:hypothetical protein
MALERLNFGQDDAKVLFRALREYMIKEAFCNPCLIKGGVRPLRDGDLFIFHHKDFCGGEQGREAAKGIKMKMKKALI